MALHRNGRLELAGRSALVVEGEAGPSCREVARDAVVSRRRRPAGDELLRGALSASSRCSGHHPTGVQAPSDSHASTVRISRLSASDPERSDEARRPLCEGRAAIRAASKEPG